jgi:putative SOS response-associated peptidase YedK
MPEAKAELLHWGLIPFWSKDRKMGYNLINDRLETVADKPSFRAAFKKRHVIIPATGYYEWRPIENGAKQAYHITRPDPIRLFSVLRFCGFVGALAKRRGIR